MKSLLFKFARIILVSLLSSVFFLATYGKTFYTHSHILNDGKVMTHAHPYNKSTDNNPYKTHHHNTLELLIFKILSYSAPTIFFLLLSLSIRRLNIFEKTPTEKYFFICWRHINGRAPPYFFNL